MSRMSMLELVEVPLLSMHHFYEGVDSVRNDDTQELRDQAIENWLFLLIIQNCFYTVLPLGFKLSCGKSVKYRYIEFFAFDYDSLPISF